jgi:cysteine desulfurase / selenocysteine lyase
MLDNHRLREDFPIFSHQPNLVYLDSAATALKPRMVIDAMHRYYSEYPANVGRGLYPLAARATKAFETARNTIAQFIGAEPTATVFTANATHAINLVALGIEETLSPKHSVVVTALEHHSNYLPWKELCRRTGATFRTASFAPDGSLDPETIARSVDASTTIVAFSAVSNVFGVVSPIAAIVRAIRAKNPQTLVLVDACQLIGHQPIDITAWDADFIVFSGHKVFGPTGIGVLAGKRAALLALSPMNVGGGTVLDACSDQPKYKDLPENLEGGTPNIAGAIGLGAAIDYINGIGLELIREHEAALMQYISTALKRSFGSAVHIIGTTDPNRRAGIITFSLEGMHPHDIAEILGESGIAVRAGEHCAAPLHRHLGLAATTRVSVSVYTGTDDIDQLIAGLEKAKTLFRV